MLSGLTRGTKQMVRQVLNNCAPRLPRQLLQPHPTIPLFPTPSISCDQILTSLRCGTKRRNEDFGTKKNRDVRVWWNTALLEYCIYSVYLPNPPKFPNLPFLSFSPSSTHFVLPPPQIPLPSIFYSVLFQRTTYPFFPKLAFAWVVLCHGSPDDASHSRMLIRVSSEMERV